MENENTREKIKELYERNADSIYKICYSYMKNKLDAEDVLQETFMKVMEKNIAFKDEHHERGWLILTASNLCKDNLKNWWRKNRRYEEYDRIVEENISNTDYTLLEIMKLPSKYKIVLFLYYYEGYSSIEIGNIVGKKDATVRSVLKRGRDMLKKRLAGADNE